MSGLGHQFSSWLNRLFNKHLFVRRALVLWAMVLITIVIFKVLDTMTTIDAATASVITAIIGILATVTGFYIKIRELDNDDS